MEQYYDADGHNITADIMNHNPNIVADDVFDENGVWIGFVNPAADGGIEVLESKPQVTITASVTFRQGEGSPARQELFRKLFTAGAEFYAEKYIHENLDEFLCDMETRVSIDMV